MINKQNLFMAIIWWSVMAFAILYGLFFYSPVVTRDYAGRSCYEDKSGSLVLKNGGLCIQCDYVDGECVIGTGFGE